MSNKHTIRLGQCILPGAVSDADAEPTYDPSATHKFVVNGPPSDWCCRICERPMSELSPFGGPGDPLPGDFNGMKLVKRHREDLPGYSGSSWECRDCFVRPGGMWELRKEDKLGRPLTDEERATMLNKVLKQMSAQGLL